MSAARTARADLERFLEHLAEHRRLSAHTVSAYRRDLEQLIAFAEERLDAEPTVEDLDILVLRRWLGEAARSVKSSTIARKIAACRSFFRWPRWRARRRRRRAPIPDASFSSRGATT